MTAHEPPSRPGQLIAVSGADGSGKSTLVAALLARLEAEGCRAIAVSPLKPPFPPVLPWARESAVSAELKEPWMAQYVAMAFADHVERIVRPAVLEGVCVVADRWVLDHLANQAAMGVPAQVLAPWFVGVPVPDTHVVLDVPPQIAADRIAARKGPRGFGDRISFITRAHAGMLDSALHPALGGIRVLDGTRPTVELVRAVLEEARVNQL